MRETATGAESDAAKVDGGKAPGKASAEAPAADGSSTSVKKTRTIIAPKANPNEVNPVAERGGSAPLFTAPAGEPDDLKWITGIGPVLEGRLNGLGITKWSQIAAFSAQDITSVEDMLSFKGRITRDNWLAQAEVLARGGTEEYTRVFGKKSR